MDTDEWTSPRAGAAHLGISDQLLYAAVKRGELPAFQPTGKGGRILLRWSDLNAWVERGALTTPMLAAEAVNRRG